MVENKELADVNLPVIRSPQEEHVEQNRPAVLALMSDLLHMDALARKQGHSLTELLAKAAKDAYGIDVRPPALTGSKD